MFTVNKKSLQSMVRPVQIFDTAYQAFLSLNVNIGITLDWVKICLDLHKVVKVFKNDHSLWPVNSEIHVI